MAFTGPGALSADAALGIDRSGPSWGVAALAIGLVGGGPAANGQKAKPGAEGLGPSGRLEAYGKKIGPAFLGFVD